jgi:hypothetical protein
MSFELKWVGVSPYKKKRIWGYLVDDNDNLKDKYRRHNIRTFWGYEDGKLYFQVAKYDGVFVKKLQKRKELHPAAPDSIVQKVKREYSEDCLFRVIADRETNVPK